MNGAELMKLLDAIDEASKSVDAWGNNPSEGLTLRARCDTVMLLLSLRDLAQRAAVLLIEAEARRAQADAVQELLADELRQRLSGEQRIAH